MRSSSLLFSGKKGCWSQLNVEAPVYLTSLGLMNYIKQSINQSILHIFCCSDISGSCGCREKEGLEKEPSACLKCWWVHKQEIPSQEEQSRAELLVRQRRWLFPGRGIQLKFYFFIIIFLCNTFLPEALKTVDFLFIWVWRPPLHLTSVFLAPSSPLDFCPPPSSPSADAAPSPPVRWQRRKHLFWQPW